VYQRAVDTGLWDDPWQRPWPNYDKSLSRAPWHENPWFAKQLEDAYSDIKDEYLNVVHKRQLLSTNPVEDIVESGAWDEFNIVRRGRMNSSSCLLTPKTCAAVANFKEITGLVDGQQISGEVEWLTLAPGTHLKAHCGTTNKRLTMHLGVIVPDGPLIRCGNVTRKWEEGKAIVFDDSYEHEVWHHGTEARVVLYISFWHPQLWDKIEENTLGPL